MLASFPFWALKKWNERKKNEGNEKGVGWSRLHSSLPPPRRIMFAVANLCAAEMQEAHVNYRLRSWERFLQLLVNC